MVQEKMNVHKALSELKVLDSRVTDAIYKASFVITNKHSNQKVSGIPVGELCKKMEEGYQSVVDLIARREAIKRAVVLSNAVTKVTIGSREYTVAEAIEMKNHGVELKQLLLNQLRAQYAQAKREADAANGDVLERRADEYIKTVYGNADMKNASADVQKARTSFVEAQTVELVDPLKIADKIKELEDEISTFMVEVDSALSVSNAMTTIEVAY